MKITFDTIEEKDRNLINTLLQFENYDFCNFYGRDLNEDGKFQDEIPDSFINEKNSYIVRADGKIAGFILVRKKIALNTVEEFWIYPKYRQGLFVYKVLREFSKTQKGLMEYLVLKENDRWLKTLQYMFKKHPDYVKIEICQDIQFFINGKVHDFVRYVVRIQERDEK